MLLSVLCMAIAVAKFWLLLLLLMLLHLWQMMHAALLLWQMSVLQDCCKPLLCGPQANLQCTVESALMSNCNDSVTTAAGSCCFPSPAVKLFLIPALIPLNSSR
jgi:hypothetical protein